MSKHISSNTDGYFRNAVVAGLLGALAVGAPTAVLAAAPAKAATDVTKPAAPASNAKSLQDGKWMLPDGSPTYDVKDGSVDWSTFSGYRRYNSECIVCHGPDGAGSTYAPDLTNSLKSMDYGTFLQVVASGKNDNSGGTQFVMPALGDNKNVMCYVNDIYVYLKARADGVVGRGRPEKHADKPKEATAAENACMGP